MTTINCSSNCIHQVDGLCTLDAIPSNSVFINSDCVFFQERIPVGDKNTCPCPKAEEA